MARKGGSRRKRVSILTKSIRTKGKISQKRYLAVLNEGDKVTLTLEPGIQKGMFHPRFSGKTGTVLRKTGTCYEVKIKDMDSVKSFIVHPIHLKKL